MNNQHSTEREIIPDFVNLEEFNNLLGELNSLKDLDQLSKVDFEIKFQIPEIIIESIKMIAGFFRGISFDEYKKRIVLNAIRADVDLYLTEFHFLTQLQALLEKI